MDRPLGQSLIDEGLGRSCSFFGKTSSRSEFIAGDNAEPPIYTLQLQKKRLNFQKRLILLDDPSISMIESDLTPGEVPPTLTLPLRGGRDGWGRTIHVLFYATLRFIHCNYDIAEVPLSAIFALFSDHRKPLDMILIH